MSDDLLRFPSGRSVGNCRNDAKLIAKAKNIKLAVALDQVALANGGLRDWSSSIQHLRTHGGDLKPSVGRPTWTMTRADVQAVIYRHPITHSGFLASDGERKHYGSMEAAIRAGQASLLEHLDECNRAAQFLRFAVKRKTINSGMGSSYGLKHEAERFHESLLARPKNPYIANGSFICAALHMGFEMKASVFSLNVEFNISSRSPVFEWELLNSRSKQELTRASHNRLDELCLLLGMPSPGKYWEDQYRDEIHARFSTQSSASGLVV